MIEQAIEKWHRLVESGDLSDLEELLSDEVVFYSPIVYTPQRGREITTLYLQGAASTLLGSDRELPFRYTKQVLKGDTAVLEFETEIEGKYVNGVDIIRCDDTGRIVEFRVMLRPLQAVNLLHQKMQAMLEALSA